MWCYPEFGPSLASQLRRRVGFEDIGLPINGGRQPTVTKGFKTPSTWSGHDRLLITWTLGTLVIAGPKVHEFYDVFCKLHDSGGWIGRQKIVDWLPNL